MKKTNSEARNVVEARLAVGLIAGLALWKNVRGLYRRLFDESKIAVGVGPNGASDFLGYISETIDDEWIARNRGTKIARFVAVEFKADNDSTKPDHLAAQAEFIATIEKAGGYAGFARSGDDVKRILRLKP
jgi:hypothetical protein